MRQPDAFAKGAARRRPADPKANLRRLLQEFTVGDPMRAASCGRTLSLRELSRRLVALERPPVGARSDGCRENSDSAARGKKDDGPS